MPRGVFHEGFGINPLVQSPADISWPNQNSSIDSCFYAMARQLALRPGRLASLDVNKDDGLIADLLGSVVNFIQKSVPTIVMDLGCS